MHEMALYRPFTTKHSFIRSFIRSFIHSFIHVFAQVPHRALYTLNPKPQAAKSTFCRVAVEVEAGMRTQASMKELLRMLWALGLWVYLQRKGSFVLVVLGIVVKTTVTISQGASAYHAPQK